MGARLPADSAIVFDLGGTHLRCASVVGNELVNVKRERIRSFHHGLSPAAVWEEILAGITEYTRNSNNLVGSTAPLAVSFPGPLYEDGRIVNAPTVAVLDERVPDIRAELAQRTGRNVYILNDVSAAALYLAGHCRWERLMVITVSSGIGSKICYQNSHGTVLLDKGPYAGEIGHLTIDDSESAPVCDCGRRGHLGAIASGRGVENLARQRATADPESFAQSLCRTRFGGDAQKINNEEHFVPAVRAGDTWALEVLRQATQPLAQVVSATIFAAGLQGILIIGGFALSIGPVYLQLLHRLIQRHCNYSAIDFSPEMVEFGQMSEEACLRGAAEYAFMSTSGDS